MADRAENKTSAASRKNPERKKLKVRKGFTQVYNSCIDSTLLTQYEKLIFITIKSYADRKTGKAFPSLRRISAATGTSVTQVRRSIDYLEEIGLLDVEHRLSTDSGNMVNIYTIHDSPEIWEVSGSEDEDLQAFMDEISDEKFLEEAKRRGFRLIKEESPSNADQSQDEDPNEQNTIVSDNHIANLEENQEEAYTMEFLQSSYDYWALIHDHPDAVELIDYVFNLIYDTVNGNSEKIRVQRTDRPREIVTGRLLKLSGSEIYYVIQRFRKQTNKIRNAKSYLLTQLYEAAGGQMTAEIENQARHDIYGTDDTD